MMKVIDNYLNEDLCDDIVSRTIKNQRFPLYLNHTISTPTSNDGIFLTHNFLDNGVESDWFHVVKPLLKRVQRDQDLMLIRIKLNLYPKTFFVKKHPWHTDYPFQHKGLIYYLNTNNGRTDFRNLGKVKSVKNRAVFHDPSEPHRSTTCSDSLFRSNIVINYN